MLATQCFSRDALGRYLQGRVDDHLGQSIEQHLHDCTACQETISSLDDCDDTLVRTLRIGGGQAGAVTSPSPDWIEQLAHQPARSNTDDHDRHDARDPLDSAADEPQCVDPDASPETVRTLGDYELVGLLGRGGMSVVFAARHRHLGRDAALKVLLPRNEQHRVSRDRFAREMRAVGSLDHSSIVRATDAGQWQGTLYLVMEQIEGIDLKRAMRAIGTLSVADACAIIVDVARGLDHAHQKGVVHRDIKPSNVMLDRSGRVKILDFGLARVQSTAADVSLQTTMGQLLGTLDYMAPEQARGTELDARADIYALGATLFELLAGHPPHGRSAEMPILEFLNRLANDQAPSIDSVADRFPPLLTETLDQMLQRDPQQRPGSAAEVAERLEPLIEGCDLTKLVKQAFDVAPLQFKSIDSLDEDLLPGWKSPPLAEAEAEYDNEASDNPEAQSARQPDGHRRRFRRWPTIATAMMGLMSLVALGVVLTLRSAEGEIRIESELDNVTVQIVDETQRSETLAVEQGQTATTVRTGRYRIQLESPTDGVEITPSLVTVKRNEAVVARIIKVNDTEKAAATQSTVPNTDTMIAEITAKLKEATQQDEPDQQLVEQLQQQLTHLRAISRPIPTEPVYDGRTLAEWVALMRFEHKQSERVTAARNVIQLAETQPPARRAALVFEAVPIADANVYPNRGFEWLTYRSDWQNSGWFTAELAWPILTELPPQILEDQLAQSLASEDSDERYFALMVCLRASDRIREQGWAKVQRALDELIASSKQSEEQTVAQVVRAACEPDVSEAAKMLSAISSEDASVHVLLGMIYAAQERPQIATRERELEWVAHLLPRISSFETLDLVWTEGKAAVGPLRPIDWDNVTPAQQADINAVVQPLLQSFAERLDDVDAAQRDASAHLAAAANGRTLAVMIQQTDLTGETRDQAISLLDRRLKQVVEYRNHVEWTPNTENFFVAKLDSPAALGIALVLLTGEFPDSLRQPLRAQTGRLAEHNSSYSTSHPNKRWGGVRGNAFDANAWLPYEILMRFAEWFNMKEWDWARGYLIAVDPLLAVTFAMAGDDVVARVATQLMVGDGGALTRTGRSGPDVGIVTSMRRHAAFAERMRHEMNEAESLTTRHLAFLVWATAQDEPTITEQMQQWLTSDDVMEMRFAIHLVAGSPESRTVHAMLWQAIERLAARQRLSAAELEALIQIGTAEAGQLAADQMRALIQEIKDQPSGQPISQELKSEFDMGMFILASRYPEKFESLKPVLNQLDDAQFQRLKTTGFGWQKALELRE